MTTNLDNNEINMGDQSVIVIGGENMFNYFGSSDDIQNSGTPISAAKQTRKPKPEPTPMPTLEPTLAPTPYPTAEPTLKPA